MEAKDVRNLMEAYASVHAETEQVDEDLQSTVKGALEAGAKFVKTNPVGKALGAVVAPVGKGSGTVTQAQQQAKVKSNVKEEDVFDLIKGHLMSEGYADSEEAAIKIMSSMSETWKESILEGVGGYDDPVLGPQTPLGQAARTGARVVKGAVTGAISGAQSALKPPAAVKPVPSDPRLVDVSSPAGQAAIKKAREGK